MSKQRQRGRVLDDAAVLDFPLTGVHLIEASAGTGKTYSIANLYLRQILAGREVGEVLVVTFTNAATDELRGRLRARLFDALERLEQGRDGKDAFLNQLAERIRADGEAEQAMRRLRLAVRAMDEAAVFSIHGFCHRALSEFAFNSGQGFGVEVLTDDAELRRIALQDWWRRRAYPLDAAKAALLEQAVGDLEQFRGQLQPLLKPEPRRLLPAVDDVAEVLGRLDALLARLRKIGADWPADGARIKTILTGTKALSQARKSPYRKDVLPAAFADLDAYFAEGAAALPPEAFASLSPATMDCFRLKKPDPALDDPFFARCGEVQSALDDLRNDLRAAALTDAASFVREELTRINRDGRQLSFDELLTTLRDALAGDGGVELAAAIARRFPVAMIDEFQDTDALQWEIFRRLYVGLSGPGSDSDSDSGAPGTGLLLIGDPKQAIYSFRGGDIFTYMAAQRSVAPQNRATLLTNWRSTPEVVGSVNAVFSRRTDAFVFVDAIGFQPSTAAAKAHWILVEEGTDRPALTLWRLPVGDNGKPLNKDDARALANRAVADEIVRLINGARAGRVRLVERASGQADQSGQREQESRPLSPKDIAILVRTRRAGAELRRALAARGVAAVSVERASVYDSEEARALETLMQAALDPRERGAPRLALASTLLGLTYAEMERIAADEMAWADWVDGLVALREAWQRRGFMAMFQRLLWDLTPGGRPVAEVIAAGADAERRLTNLLHLGELVQQAAREQAGMDALLNWFRVQRLESGGDQAGDEQLLRLESDAGLVQIVTVHAAKGLQYPVVFLPDQWDPKITKKDQPIGFHDTAGDLAPLLDIGSDERDRHLCLAERERLAEDVRLAYVALTRAQSAQYLVWGRAGRRDGHAGAAALGWLLHPHQAADVLTTELPNAFAAESADLDADLEALVQSARATVLPLGTELAEPGQGHILLESLQPPDPLERVALLPAEVSAPRLEPARFTGRLVTDWRIASFSSLMRARSMTQPDSVAVAGAGQRVDDEPAPQASAESGVDALGAGLAAAAQSVAGSTAEPVAEPIASLPADDDPALRYPAGSDVGTFLHLLLEHLDFTGDLPAQIEPLSERYSARFGLDHRRHGADTALLLARAVRTPLTEAGLRLADLPAECRLNELAFDLSTRHTDIAALNGLLVRHARASAQQPESAGPVDPPAEPLAKPPTPLAAADFSGMVTGVIDLVFQHDGRFFVADYKSNLLGRRFDDYAPPGLVRAVGEHRYDLQYLLYTLALHRYLRTRISGYDYRQHLGGVFYLFLRGMRPETGPARGVFFTRPDAALIDELDEAIFAWEGSPR